jgi:hypothetical protein
MSAKLKIFLKRSNFEPNEDIHNHVTTDISENDLQQRVQAWQARDILNANKIFHFSSEPIQLLSCQNS